MNFYQQRICARIAREYVANFITLILICSLFSAFLEPTFLIIPLHNFSSIIHHCISQNLTSHCTFLMMSLWHRPCKHITDGPTGRVLNKHLMMIAVFSSKFISVPILSRHHSPRPYPSRWKALGIPLIPVPSCLPACLPASSASAVSSNQRTNDYNDERDD